MESAGRVVADPKDVDGFAAALGPGETLALLGDNRRSHCMRPGRRLARVRIGSLRGLRLRGFDEALVAEAVDLHRRALSERDTRVIRSDGRSRITALRLDGRAVVVKEVVHGGFARRLADLFRGSPARRAWRGGHGLIARGVVAATPLAFLERRRLGVPVASLVVIEDARTQGGSSCAVPLDQLAADAGIDASLVDAVVRLLVRLHGSNADHGDLKASHVFAGREAGEWQVRLVDLEGVRFRRRLRDSRRILALAQLNASLPDALAAAERCRAFAGYARRLPFRRGAELALEGIVALSLERADCWTGAGCGVKRPDRAARARARLGASPDHS
jgi:hypothetical protein